MAKNTVQDIYSSEEQIKFAREMAKILLNQKKNIPSPGMAVLPGSWMYNIRDLTDAIAGTQYRDIAGSQEKLLRDLEFNPHAQPTLGRYGSKVKNIHSHSGDHGSAAGKLASAAAEGVGGVISKLVKTLNFGKPKTAAVAPEAAPELTEADPSSVVAGQPPMPESDAAPDASMSPIETGSISNDTGAAVDPRVAHATNENFEAELERSLANSRLTPEQKERYKRELRTRYGRVASHLGREPSMAELAASEAVGGQTLTEADKRVHAPPMRLGGPSEADIPPRLRAGSGDELAQAPYESRTGEGAGKEHWIDIDGYRGYAPAIPYVETQEQMRNRLNTVPLSKQRELMDDWRNRQKPIYKEVTDGVIEMTPKQGGGGTYKFFASPKRETLDGVPIFTELDKDGNKQYKLMIPGMEGKTFDSKSDALEGWKNFKQFRRDEKEKDIRQEGRASTVTQAYAKLEDDITERARSASKNRQMLAIAKTLSNDPDFYSGVGNQRVLNFKKLASVLTGDPKWSGSSEAFAKIIAGSNIAGLAAFKGYGQIRNPEIELLQEASGNLENTPGAIQAIIHINDKAGIALEKIDDLMRDYRRKHGRLDEGFDDILSKYLRENPLLTDDEIKGYKEMFKTDKMKKKESTTSNEGTWGEIIEGVTKKRKVAP